MKIILFTGAGISQESGISTFRGSDGLWEGHDIMEVASPEGYRKNPELVLDFYNKRRRQLLSVKPNPAHDYVAKLEKHFNTVVITQNVDDLHERAGSTRVIHLHGELLKARSNMDREYIISCKKDITLQDRCPKGHSMRPDIVWFGEDVPEMELAIDEVKDADICIVVGTSLQVYPAAGLIHYLPAETELFYIDPSPNYGISDPRIRHVVKKASEGMKIVYEKLISDLEESE